MMALAVIGAFSFSVLVVQLLGAQESARAVQIERDRAVSELGGAKGQLESLARELAAAKASRAEQIIATDKDARRIEGEVATLKTQRAALAAQVDELAKRQQEAERRLATVTQRRDEVESQLAALRAELATAQAGSHKTRHKTRKPASTSEDAP